MQLITRGGELHCTLLSTYRLNKVSQQSRAREICDIIYICRLPETLEVHVRTLKKTELIILRYFTSTGVMGSSNSYKIPYRLLLAGGGTKLKGFDPAAMPLLILKTLTYYCGC